MDSEHEVDYCDRENQRRIYEDKAKTALIPAIVGTSLFVVGAVPAILFYMHPEWFKSSEDRARLTLTPIADSRMTGLVLSCSF